jgi:hypothetical protein
LSTRPGSRFRWGPRCRRTARRSPRLARALGGGRGALSDSSVVPLARGVARAAHLAALSGAVRGRGERKTHFSSTVRGSHACSHVSLSADRCASRMGRALSSAPGARTATLSAQRDVGRGPRFVTLSTGIAFVIIFNPRGLRLGQFFTKDESHETALGHGVTGHVPRWPLPCLGDLFPYQFRPALAIALARPRPPAP